MKNKFNFFLIGIFLFSIEAFSAPTAAVTVHVVDEQGAPVEEANVLYSLRENSLEKSEVVKTDKQGIARISIAAKNPNIGISVRKDRYYESSLSYDFTGSKGDYKNNISGVIGLRQWEPYNPTINIVLKKISHPIPLFVARALMPGDLYDPVPITIPIVDDWVGYDLLETDWVAPYGKGVTADFLFKLHRGDVVYDTHNWPISGNATLEIKFSNDGDGIQEFYRDYEVGSELISSHHAPLHGYIDYLLLSTEGKVNIPDSTKKTGLVFVRANENQEIKKDKRGINYYFRIRTKKDPEGNIIGALYGKIYGFFEWDLLVKGQKSNSLLGKARYGKSGSVTFLYYINPAINDVNIEYDRKSNLNLRDKSPKDWKP